VRCDNLAFFFWTAYFELFKRKTWFSSGYDGDIGAEQVMMVSQSVNQPIGQPISQPAILSVNQPVNQPANQPASQLVS
jgi:hypothetical protein